MVKYMIYLMLFVVALGLIIGGGHLCLVTLKNKREMAKYSGEKIEVAKDLGRVLVVYYSLSGNTKDIAERIKAKTGADIYEIKTLKDYKAGLKLYISAKKQLKEGIYPELEGEMPKIENYDTIFVGAPVWWYTMAPPAHAFLNNVDFIGKRVVPFSTQGSNYGTFFDDFNAKVKNAVILQNKSFNNMPEKYAKEIDNKISVWINGL